MTARLKETTAAVCPSYAMLPVGGFGIRGWRVHCPACSFLSAIYSHIRSAQDAQRKHRCAS